MTEPEILWSGSFGDDYLERNRGAGQTRGPFWQKIVSELAPRGVLEVGCNVGTNLRWIASNVAPHDVVGVDINQKALRELRDAVPGIHALLSSARALPFQDESFDLVFTMGVLIHQAPEGLPEVMREIVRCSRRFILCGEYYASERIEVPYRGQQGALYKQDFGALYQSLFPDLELSDRGFLSREMGWDDVTYWVFEKARA